MPILQNASLRLDVDLEQHQLAFIPVEDRFPSLKGITLSVTLQGRGRSSTSHRVQLLATLEHSTTATQHGRTEMLHIPVSIPGTTLNGALRVGITEDHPLIMWKLSLHNHGEQAARLARIAMLHIDARNSDGVAFPKAEQLSEKGFYSHGWQSWSLSAAYRGDERMENSRLYQLQTPMIYSAGTPVPSKRGVFSSEMFAVIGDRESRTGCLVGFLSQREQFGSILMDFNSNRLQMWANGDSVRFEPGMDMETDWAVFTPILLDHRAPLEQYQEAVGRENHARNRTEVPPGWCSWYHYYTHVTADDVTENLHKILEQQEQLPLQVVQVDDGFETNVGDWYSFKPTFPQGVSVIAEQIHGEGLMPGLWLAPFAVHPKSELMKQHPDWILRGGNGLPVNAGFGWNALFTGLDLTHPEALAYACQVVRTAAQEWGYPYLKLDFLYAAALPGRYKDPRQTRAQVLYSGMRALRDAMGEKTLLLGCGLPIGSGIGIVDAMRISADVSGNWYPKMFGIERIFRNEPAMPCARNSVRNTITRAWQHRTWWTNDPDCLLIRPESNLTLAEVQSMATVIGMIGGMLLISDDLTRVPVERLRIATQLIPAVQEPVRVLDWFDARMPAKLRLDMLGPSGAWQVISCSNWSDEERSLDLDLMDYQLEDGEYLYREFWSGKTGKVRTGDPVRFDSLPPHSSLLLALRKLTGKEAFYLGSDLHFTQGNEVSEWLEDRDRINLSLRLPRTAAGKIYLYLPNGIKSVYVDESEVDFQHEGDHVFSLPVDFQGFCRIGIKKGSG